jgi:hypothetical protein
MQEDLLHMNSKISWIKLLQHFITQSLLVIKASFARILENVTSPPPPAAPAPTAKPTKGNHPKAGWLSKPVC